MVIWSRISKGNWKRTGRAVARAFGPIRSGLCIITFDKWRPTAAARGSDQRSRPFLKPPQIFTLRDKFTTPAENCNQLIYYWQFNPSELFNYEISKLLKLSKIKTENYQNNFLFFDFISFPSNERKHFLNKTGNQCDDYNRPPDNFNSLPSMPMRIQSAWPNGLSHMFCFVMFKKPLSSLCSVCSGFPSSRTNLSPFTKDFRGGEQLEWV